MKLEASLKYLGPQGMRISDSVASTSPNRLTATDVLSALGATRHRALFGLAIFLGKTGLSERDRQQAIQTLARHAMTVAPKNVRKAAGDAFSRCMLMLAQFAFAEYSLSAATTWLCPECDGRGGCTHCGGKGVISARCRCRGTGQTLDRQATKEQGIPLFKACERCSGKGFTTTPSTKIYAAIVTLVPELHPRTWTRNWKPFFETLVDTCRDEEDNAAQIFDALTR